MTAFAHIAQQNFATLNIDIYIGNKLQGGRSILQDGGEARTVVWDQDAPTVTPLKPTLSVDEAQARALLTSLVRYFDGGDDTRALRKDYDAERARVDLLIGKLSNVVVVPS